MSAVPSPPAPRWMTQWSLAEGSQRAHALLKQTCAVRASDVWSAPGRINLVGEYTDIGAGVSLTTQVPHRTFAAAVSRPDRVVRIIIESPDEPGQVLTQCECTLDSLPNLVDPASPLAIPAGVLWSFLERGYIGTGMDIAFASCIPRTGGLSWGPALAAVTALAANDLWGLALTTDITAVELAEACMDGTNTVGGGASAGLAEHGILRGATGQALHLDFATSPVRATACPLPFEEYGLALLIIDTHMPQDDQVHTIRQRMDEVSRAAQCLGVTSIGALRATPGAPARIEGLDDPVLRKRARHVFTENERVELVMDELTSTSPAHERFVAVGKAMYRSHASLAEDFDVSTDALNRVVDAAFMSGALGAHMVGAGGGGSVVALIRRAQAVTVAKRIDAEFRGDGVSRPVFGLL